MSMQYYWIFLAAARSGVLEAVVNTIHIPDKNLQRRDTNDAKTKTNEREDKR